MQKVFIGVHETSGLWGWLLEQALAEHTESKSRQALSAPAAFGKPTTAISRIPMQEAAVVNIANRAVIHNKGISCIMKKVLVSKPFYHCYDQAW